MKIENQEVRVLEQEAAKLGLTLTGFRERWSEHRLTRLGEIYAVEHEPIELVLEFRYKDARPDSVVETSLPTWIQQPTWMEGER